MHIAVCFLLLATGALASLNVTFCSDHQCKEEPLATVTLNASDTNVCQTGFANRALAVRSEPSDPSSQPNQAIRLYRSTDCFGHCGSGHLISMMTHGFQRLVPSGSLLNNVTLLQSWELVDLDEDGRYPGHGYCGLRHGDAQFFRGRTWKWWQIGKGAFREVPVEDWNDDVHVKSVGTDYMFHGSTDESGKFKMQQIHEDMWQGVALEEWDDDVHVRVTEPLEGFQYLLADEPVDKEEREDL